MLFINTQCNFASFVRFGEKMPDFMSMVNKAGFDIQTANLEQLKNHF